MAILTENERELIYEEGYDAGFDGKSKNSNPYTEGDLEAIVNVFAEIASLGTYDSSPDDKHAAPTGLRSVQLRFSIQILKKYPSK